MANVKDEKWIKRFSEVVELFATWSKDDSTCVGAVVVTESCKIIGQGFNGPFKGMDDNISTLGRDFKLAHTIHAEANALADAAKVHTDEDTYLFVSAPICLECAKQAILYGIKGVYCNVKFDDEDFNRRWKNEDARMVLRNMNVTYTKIQKDTLK